MKIKQGSTWRDIPASAAVYAPDTGEGYLVRECPDGSFVAGSVMSLDCNVVATRNQAPATSVQAINLQTNAPRAISLDAADTDRDYLKYRLVQLPTNGFLNHNSKAEKIPNTDGDSASLVYTPAGRMPESDAIRYSVTDGRHGHTREGLISIIGVRSAATVPDAVDDLAFGLSGNVISFSWSHPADGGSEITYYRVERSNDAASWSLHDTLSETVTGFDYARQPGYDQYFRIFAYNDMGQSASSNLVHVHIRDNTPPTITISSPVNGATVATQNMEVAGHVGEPDSSRIEYVKIYADGAEIADPVAFPFSSGVYVSFRASITGLANGVHNITVKTANGDGVTASKSVTVTRNAHVPATLLSFVGDFEDGSNSNWKLTTDDDEYWTVRNFPIEPVPNSGPNNKVVGTEDCDDICSMIMVDRVDLTQMTSPVLSFYRFVATGADVSNSEGIYVYTSADDGATWSLLSKYTANDRQDTGAWSLERFDLPNASDSFKLRFDARSSSNSEDTELDDIRIFDDKADTTPPSIAAPPDRTFEALAAATSVNSIRLGPATVSDDTDSSPGITNDAPSAFPLGDTAVTWTATDAAGNSATDTQTVTVRDTTPPKFTRSTAYVWEYYPAQENSSMSYQVTAADTVSSVRYGVTGNTDIPIGNRPAIGSDGTVTWTPGEEHGGNRYYTYLTASDSSGNGALQRLRIQVADTGIPVPAP